MSEQTQRPFGYHLIMDCYLCDPATMNDMNHCAEYFNTLVKEMKVHRQSPPIIFGDPPGFPDKSGMSAWQPIVESGLSIHSLRAKNYFSIDAYSCKEFDPNVIIQITQQFFNPRHIEDTFLLRGTKYFDPEYDPKNQTS